MDDENPNGELINACFLEIIALRKCNNCSAFQWNEPDFHPVIGCNWCNVSHWLQLMQCHKNKYFIADIYVFHTCDQHWPCTEADSTHSDFFSLEKYTWNNIYQNQARLLRSEKEMHLDFDDISVTWRFQFEFCNVFWNK